MAGEGAGVGHVLGRGGAARRVDGWLSIWFLKSCGWGGGGGGWWGPRLVGCELVFDLVRCGGPGRDNICLYELLD